MWLHLCSEAKNQFAVLLNCSKIFTKQHLRDRKFRRKKVTGFNLTILRQFLQQQRIRCHTHEINFKLKSLNQSTTPNERFSVFCVCNLKATNSIPPRAARTYRHFNVELQTLATVMTDDGDSYTLWLVVILSSFRFYVEIMALL